MKILKVHICGKETNASKQVQKTRQKALESHEKIWGNMEKHGETSRGMEGPGGALWNTHWEVRAGARRRRRMKGDVEKEMRHSKLKTDTEKEDCRN